MFSVLEINGVDLSFIFYPFRASAENFRHLKVIEDSTR